ncbi:hypothetical protein ACFRFL_44815, partial [Streptomyces sp. NPDC056708]
WKRQNSHHRRSAGTSLRLAIHRPPVNRWIKAKARTMLAPYLKLRNYRSAWLRGGFATEDLAFGGSNRLIDALFAWGKPAEIAARLTEHHQAGADHVAIQVVTDAPGTFARQAWRDLAPDLFTT